MNYIYKDETEETKIYYDVKYYKDFNISYYIGNVTVEDYCTMRVYYKSNYFGCLTSIIAEDIPTGKLTDKGKWEYGN